MTDVVGNPEEERRADFYYQPWAQEAVCRYFYSKVLFIRYNFLPDLFFLFFIFHSFHSAPKYFKWSVMNIDSCYFLLNGCNFACSYQKCPFSHQHVFICFIAFFRLSVHVCFWVHHLLSPYKLSVMTNNPKGS